MKVILKPAEMKLLFEALKFGFEELWGEIKEADEDALETVEAVTGMLKQQYKAGHIAGFTLTTDSGEDAAPEPA